MNIIKIAVSIGVIVSVMVMDAKEKKPDITIENHSDGPITVFFRATGCAKSIEKRHYVCKAQTIQPHTPTGPGSSSYDWRWGQTGKNVSVKVYPYIFRLKKKPEGKYLWKGLKNGNESKSKDFSYSFRSRY